MFKIMHVPMEQNVMAGLLSKLTSLKKAWFNCTVIQETFTILNIEVREVNVINIALTDS